MVHTDEGECHGERCQISILKLLDRSMTKVSLTKSYE